MEVVFFWARYTCKPQPPHPAQKHSMYGAATKDVDMSKKPTKIRFD